MKKISISMFMIIISISAHAELSAKEESCLKNYSELKKSLATENDSVLNGFINLLPEYKNQLEMKVADPYICSLANYDR